MTTLRPLGYDPDWYDNGYGSENFKQRIRESQKEFNKNVSITIQSKKMIQKPIGEIEPELKTDTES